MASPAGPARERTAISKCNKRPVWHRTFKVAKELARVERLVLDELGKEVVLVEQQVDGRVCEERVVDRLLKEAQRLAHAVDGAVLKEHVGIVGQVDNEHDRLYIVKAVHPLAALGALTAHVHDAGTASEYARRASVGNALELARRVVNHGRRDAEGYHARHDSVLLRRLVVWRGDTRRRLKVAVNK